MAAKSSKPTMEMWEKIEQGIGVKAFLDRKEEFQKQYLEDDFPEDLIREYEPMTCLSRKMHCTTFLLRGRDGGGLFVAKAYPVKEFEAAEGAILQSLSHPGIPKMKGGVYLAGDSEVVDSMALNSLNNLRDVNVGGASGVDHRFLAGQSASLASLCVSHCEATETMPYLVGKSFDYLNLAQMSGLTMDMLETLGSVRRLGLRLGPVVLTGIEKLEGLEELCISATPLQEAEALLECPNLKRLETNRANRPLLLSLPQPLPFGVEYI